MKHINKKLFSGIALLSGALISSSLSTAAVKKVEYADIYVQLPAPVIKVTGKGSTYTTASSSTLKFHASAKGKCTFGHKYDQVYQRISEPGHQAKHVSDFLAHDVLYSDHNVHPNNQDRTWSSSPKPVSINWKPNQKIRDAAVKSCNDKRKSLIASGQAPSGSFKAPALTNLITREFHFSCSAYAGVPAWERKDVVKQQPIDVKCEQLEPVKASLAIPPGGLNPVTVKHIAVSADPKTQNAICPADVTFKGSINTSGAGGKLKYRFRVNGKAISAYKEVAIKSGNRTTNVWGGKTMQPTAQGGQGNNAAPLQVNQGGAQAIPQMGMAPTEKVVLEVKKGNDIRKAEGQFAINCKTIQPIKATTRPKTAKLSPAKLNAADLTSRGGILIGSVNGSWGQTMQLKASDATATSARGCQFRFRYNVANIGKAKAQGFMSRLRKGNTVLHTKQNMAINKGKNKSVSGNILLKGGNYALTLNIDDAKSVAESNENNNQYSVNLKVPASCGR